MREATITKVDEGVTFTPGPWRVRDGDEFTTVNADVVSSAGALLATAYPQTIKYPYPPETIQEAEANAKLMAAAPDMYAALKVAREYVGLYFEIVKAKQMFAPVNEVDIAQIEAALAKATP